MRSAAMRSHWAPAACSTSRAKSTPWSSTASRWPSATTGSSCDPRRDAGLGRPPGRWRPAMPVLLDQPVLQRVVRQIAVGLELQLLEHTRAVGTDGLDAQAHRIGQLAHRFATCQAQEYL